MEILKALFPDYQIDSYRGIRLRTSVDGTFSRNRQNGLIILPSRYSQEVNDSLYHLPKTPISSAKRKPNRRSDELLEKEAKGIIKRLSTKNPPSDMIRKNLLIRQLSLEEARYALSLYLD
mgnify:CR=1 FL=1